MLHHQAQGSSAAGVVPMERRMVVGDDRERRLRGDALLLAHCRMIGAASAPPRRRLEGELGERFASVLVSALVPQTGRRGSSSP